MYANGIESYRKANVMTADPKRLVIMCYEGAVESLKLAKERLRQEDYAGKGEALMKAHDIIAELLCSLDYERGGVIARNLDSLYQYMMRRITHADLHKDADVIDEVIGLLNTLLSAWKEIFYKGVEGNLNEPPEAAVEKRQAVSYAGA